MIITISHQKGGVGKTTTAANLAVLLARQHRRVLVIDSDPQFALTRQLGTEEGSLGVNLVDVLAGRAAAADAIVKDVHGVDVIAAAPALAGVEMSLVGELGRERFLTDALEPIISEYDDIVIDTPPNLGLLTVNALVVAELVIAPVSAEDDASLHGIRELHQTLGTLSARVNAPSPVLMPILTRWQPLRISSRLVEQSLQLESLRPAARVPARSALFASAATARVPLALSAPDSAPILALRPPRSANHVGHGAMTSIRRTLTIDDPLPAANTCHVARSTAGSTAGRLRDVPLDQIRANPKQPRRRFGEESLLALADSIRERGVLQPVIVRPREPEGFELIAGERRWRAPRIAGLQTIPCLVRNTADDAVSLELALIENIARADLTVIEEARTIASLLDDLDVSRTDLARRLGRSRSDLVHTVRLLELPDQAIDLIESGQLTKGHGKALLTEPDHDRRRHLARRATESGWSVRHLEAEIVRAAESRPIRTAPRPDHTAAAATLEETISKALGIDVQARPHRRGYQLLLDQAAGDRLVQLLDMNLRADARAT
jgi:ParB family transcriptional regulator, chromosome partitioning protein